MSEVRKWSVRVWSVEDVVWWMVEVDGEVDDRRGWLRRILRWMVRMDG